MEPHVPTPGFPSQPLPPQGPSPQGPSPQGPSPHGIPPPGPSVHAPSPPSLRLQYATPGPRNGWTAGPDAPLLRVMRQVVFAVGLALLSFGLTSAWAGVYQRDAPYFAGWGAGFIGLSTPLWRVRKDEE